MPGQRSTYTGYVELPAAPDAGGQLALTTEATGAAAMCQCGLPIAEQVELTSRVWVHGDGDWRCPTGGMATPRGWSA